MAALRLAVDGFSVTVCERASDLGGKLRHIQVAGRAIDSGPTVLTMRSVFESVFADAGACFSQLVPLEPLEILARHAWTGGEQLDLFAERARSADAIGAFAGAAEARGFLAFCERAKAIFRTLDKPFVHSSRPSLPELVRRVGPHRLRALAGISPFTTLARALDGHFANPKLRQLFGRYATYCGSSPYLAPATLMLVAHVEQEGVWTAPGGLRQIVDALVRLAEQRGVVFRTGAEVRTIRADRNQGATGITLVGDETIEADAVVLNGDAAACGAGLFGPGVAHASSPMHDRERSLSALTWSLVAETSGTSLSHHNVFFSDDYRAEFDAISLGNPPADPTVYVCAPDRHSLGGSLGAERLFCIVNAPANGDRFPLSAKEIATCETRTFQRLERCGLHVQRRPEFNVVTTPSDFASLFPGTGGALYGKASHGWMASFRRPGSRTRIPRLYLAGGSTHPGPGLPMAALSGVLAAASLVQDFASTSQSRPAATRGGTSTR